MRTVVAETFEEWRDASRRLLLEETPPGDVRFVGRGGVDLFAGRDDPEIQPPAPRPHRVPPEFLQRAKLVACHRDAGRWELLYRLLWRLTHGEADLLEIATDDDVHRARGMEKAVRRDEHKMHAFVRFRRIEENGEGRYIAWHRPDHRIVRLAAPFFARRFPDMHWTILTPEESAVWDLRELTFGYGVPASAAPNSDQLEEVWRTYYRSIFNPARVNVKAMVREMPRRHWGTLPETSIIPDLLAEAPARVEEMIMRQVGTNRSAAEFIPPIRDYDALRKAAMHCEGCELYKQATQTVFGEGATDAKIMLVGEQPGVQEDQQGRPFVGPAGRVLAEALEEAGIDRSDAYVTNAVKHFKFTQRGTRRLHSKPSAREMAACRPWIEAELGLVEPEVLVCLGATAAQSLIGRDFRITRQRGEWVRTEFCERTLATWHPSAILRAPDDDRRDAMRRELVQDLRKAAEA